MTRTAHAASTPTSAALRRMAVASAAIYALLHVGQASAQTLRIVPHADLKILDPITTTANITNTHGHYIYETLFGLDEAYRPQPQMIRSFTVSADGLEYTFILRPGLSWHDGQPVTSADAVQSLKRWAAKDDEGRLAMSLTAEITVVDAQTLRWKLKEPYGNLLANLSKINGYGAFIMPEKVARTDPGTAITDTIGSGVFRFVASDWSPGSKWAYVRSDSYVPRAEATSNYAGARVAKVQRVENVYIPDQATAVAALNAGEVDFIESPNINLLPLLKSNPDIVVQSRDPLGTMVVMRPNHLHPPFNHPKARQALVYLTDQSAYMALVAGDAAYWRTCDSFFFCGMPFESRSGSVRIGQPDVERARKLMQEAGYAGEKVVILNPTDHAVSPAALLTAENLRRIGINVDLQAMDWSTMLTRRTKKEDPANGGWSILYTRWEGYYTNPIVFSAIGGGCDKAWFGWSCDTEIERLRAAWVREPDPAKQKEIVEQLHARVSENVPIVNLGQMVQPSAWRKNVTGWIYGPALVLWNVSKS